MYSNEEKERAVKLLIQYDMGYTATIKELGYPDRMSLYNWYEEYRSNGMCFPKRSKGKYTDEQKQEVVEYYLSHGRNISKTCRHFGYPCHEVLSSWVKELAGDQAINHKRTYSYSEEDKKDAVIRFCSGEKAKDVASSLSVTASHVRNWKRDLLPGPHPEASGKETEPDDDPVTLEDEVAKLRKEAELLREEVHRLQLEKDILVVASEILKKGDSICLENLTNREKATVIDALRETYKVAELIEATGIARSTYFAQKKAMEAGDKYAGMRTRLKDLFDYSYGCFGYRRLHDLLKEEGTVLSEKVIRRLMKEENIHVPSYKAPKKFSSYVGEVTPPVENLLKRDFHAEKPNQKWLTDITEFHIPAGKVYLSPVIDCFDGMPVAWTIGTSPSAELANTMLDKAIATLKPEEKPIVHSDRGGHYRWEGWISRMESNGLARSMSKKGCSPDNSACEGFFGRIKNEIFYGRDWKGWSLDDFMYFLDRYLNWFCFGRIKLGFNGKSPMERRQELGLVS